MLLQVSILDTGEVCMELLKSHSGQERVKEVLRISCDGSMVSLLYSHLSHRHVTGKGDVSSHDNTGQYHYIKLVIVTCR